MKLGKHFATLLPYLALLLAHLIWGANFVVAKFALNEFPIMSLSFLRFSLACLLIAPFLINLKSRETFIRYKDVPLLFVFGITSITLSLVFFYEGLQRTTAINASVLSLIVPVFSVLAGWWFFKEKVFIVNLFGIFFGLLGGVVILGLPLIFLGSFSTNTLVGDLLILMAGIFGVIGGIFSIRVLKKYTVVVATGVAFLVGVLTFLIPATKDYLYNPGWISAVTILGFLSLLYITILSTIVAFFLYNWGLVRKGIVKANLFVYIEPAVAATLAVFILSERISFSFIIGTILIVLGVYWGTLGKPHHQQLQHRHHRI
ncbi:DMT family transporter [Candidatus Daviesbacteria bacterium]|nr:DMT family transporter [Candidatus Daviesbacteria bacterium]